MRSVRCHSHFDPVNVNLEERLAFAYNVYGKLPRTSAEVKESFFVIYSSSFTGLGNQARASKLSQLNYEILRSEVANDLRAIEIAIRTNGELTWWLTSSNPEYRKYIEIRLTALGRNV